MMLPKKNIKIKIPSQTSYIDISADRYIYDSFTATQTVEYNPYICYKDVTDLIANTDPNGEYIVANVKATETQSGQILGGASAGWMLVIIYEDPQQTAKYITTFDGYASIQASSYANSSGDNDVYFSFSGFTTLPSPLPVNARFGVAALEGDKAIPGDQLSIKKPDNTYYDLFTSVNPSNNFFNGSISYENAILTQRRPASTNTLGWDIDLFSIPNTANGIIENDQTSATFKAYTNRDKYDIFFTAFEVEVIEPKMNLLKTVEDASGNVINNQTIALGETVYYGLEFQNVGNDNATGYSITDILPQNVTFDGNTVEIPSGSGITYSTGTLLDGSTNLVFQIPDDLITQGSGKQKIRFAVQLSNNCSDFQDVCSEVISNKAYSIYKGMLNSSTISDDGSFSSLDDCDIGTIENTIFYADVSGCSLTTEINDLLCGENLTLTAANGFDSYEWIDENGTILGNTQSIVVSNSGGYTVLKGAGSCLKRKETYTVITTQRQSENPLIPYAGIVFTCTTTQKTYPQLFLCGYGASQTLDLSSLTNVSSISWEKYTGTNTYAINATCPPEEIDSWNVIQTSKSISLTDEGIYRVLLTFENGCVATYYFRVHTSPINAEIIVEDVYCGIGKITVSGTTSDYEMAIQKEETTESLQYQSSNEFPLTEGGTYTAYIQKNTRLNEDCTIKIENIIVNSSEMILNFGNVTHETCENLNDGTISITVAYGKTPYTTSLKNQTTNTTRQITYSTDGSYTIENLSPGAYELTVSDSANCEKTATFTITESPSLDFETEVVYNCISNTTTTQLLVTFSDTSLDVSALTYSINNGTAQNFDSVNGNIGSIYQSNLTSGNHQTLTIALSSTCSVTQTFSVEIAEALHLSVVENSALISAIEVKSDGGTGTHQYYFNGINYDSNIYHLRSFDNGYTDSDGSVIKQIAVRVEDQSGCYTEMVVEELFYDIEIPEYFTPDGDGNNDTWYIKNARGYDRMRVKIFDRMGRLIKTMKANDYWDGTFNNSEMPSGDYWFLLKMNYLKDKREYIGHFTLYR